MPDLQAEYERIRSLNIGSITEILYINIVQPYFCFMLKDPDGNLLEITGEIQIKPSKRSQGGFKEDYINDLCNKAWANRFK